MDALRICKYDYSFSFPHYYDAISSRIREIIPITAKVRIHDSDFAISRKYTLDILWTTGKNEPLQIRLSISPEALFFHNDIVYLNWYEVHDILNTINYHVIRATRKANKEKVYVSDKLHTVTI